MIFLRALLLSCALLEFFGQRFAASYLNFYVANGIVLAPIFHDPADIEALTILRELFPLRHVVGIFARELIAAGGALHCMTQPQPATLSST